MCKYAKDCEGYRNDSDTCNFCPQEDMYCGYYREFESKLKRGKNEN